MKVSVVVHPLSPPPSSSMAADHSHKDSSAPAAARGGVGAVVLGVFVSVWVGSVWI